MTETATGQYQLLEKIAQGGMAEIFRAKALDIHGLERIVVIKRILPHIAASPEFIEMLIDEAKIAVQLSHGNIAQVYDLGKVADDYFIVMEYVEGKTLSQIMKRLRGEGKLMPIPCAAYLCSEIANGLDYMHRKTDEQGNPLHIIHRDISPQNAILSVFGTIKIIDFGIARAKTRISTTDSGILKGKFAYMSPEHAEGEKLDYRSDIFSLGIILFELLTGQRLFKGKNNPETIRKVKRAKVPTPSGIREEIPRALDQIVFKALQRDRNKRYQSAHDFSHDLTRFLITHYPDFSPRDVGAYLQEVFPDVGKGEKSDPALTPHGVAIPKETHKEEDKKEDETAMADSDIIRKKLKESEVFDPPQKKSEGKKPEEKEEKKQVSQKKPKRNLKIGRKIFTVAAVVLVFFAFFKAIPLALRLYPLFQSAASSFFESKPRLRKETPKPLSPTEPVRPIPLFGQLMIESEPKGAAIFLNDTDSGKKTPALIEKLPADPAHNEQKVGLYLERYKFWEQKVQIEAGKTTKLSVSLEMNVGDLSINSLPEGAEVILNGKSVGKTPFSLSQLPPNSTYEILLKYEGYEPWRGRVKVFGGKNEVVNASLKKIPLE
jgi:serine/threonine protein kinase